MKKYIVSLVFIIVSMNFTGSADDAAVWRDISSFATSSAEQDQGVKRNIALACTKLNGVVIKRGTVFSFNETVGEGSARNGFVAGRVLYRDTIVMEPGGGLCQVSSTLFNAMLLAGMNIAERHRHYQPVTYVPMGLDAAIKYGRKDLRMKNHYPFDLMIRVEAGQASLACRVLSLRPVEFSYMIDTEEEETAIPFSDVSRGIRQGVAVEVYRKKLRGSVLIDTALLYRDYYPPAYTD